MLQPCGDSESVFKLEFASSLPLAVDFRVPSYLPFDVLIQRFGRFESAPRLVFDTMLPLSIDFPSALNMVFDSSLPLVLDLDLPRIFPSTFSSTAPVVFKVPRNRCLIPVCRSSVVFKVLRTHRLEFPSSASVGFKVLRNVSLLVVWPSSVVLKVLRK